MKKPTLFSVTSDGRREISLAEIAEDFVNRLWIPDDLTPAEAAEYAFETFRSLVLDEIRTLRITPILDWNSALVQEERGVGQVANLSSIGRSATCPTFLKVNCHECQD